MKDILDKLSSYNIFNYFFPGILFAVIVGKITPYIFLQEDILVGAFVYYFLGMIISRFGSLVIEPILKRKWSKKQWCLADFADYEKFIVAEKKDTKIELLSEVNNTYRTIISMFVLLLLTKLYSFLEGKYEFLQEIRNGLFVFLLVLLLIVFIISYRKQTAFIKRRVEAKCDSNLIETP